MKRRRRAYVRFYSLPGRLVLATMTATTSPQSRLLLTHTHTHLECLERRDSEPNYAKRKNSAFDLTSRAEKIAREYVVCTMRASAIEHATATNIVGAARERARLWHPYQRIAHNLRRTRALTHSLLVSRMRVCGMRVLVCMCSGIENRKCM